MRRVLLTVMSMALAPACVFAADGQVLINQATVTASGGFPYTISQSGSYKLSGNLTLPSPNTTAIVVAADSVTIDLNGFSIIGPCATSAACASATGVGVSSATELLSSVGPVQSGFKNVAVMNGTIRGTGAGGLRVGAYSSVENMTLISTGRFGIATGDFSTVKNNRVFDTRQDNGLVIVGAVNIGGGSIASGNTVGGNYIGFVPYFGQGGLQIPSCLLIGNVAPGPGLGSGSESNAFPAVNAAGGGALLVNNLGF